MTTIIMQCNICKHYKGGWRCDAFASIPREIMFNEVSHKKSYKGDHGILFEARGE